MELITERCIIRNLCIDDVGDLYAVLSDDDVMKYIEPAFNMAKTLHFIQEAGLCDPPLVYAIIWKQTNKVIGHVIFHPFDAVDYELGWILRKDCWGKGIADELTKAMMKYAQYLGAGGCVIECAEGQVASKVIALKNGFVFVGKRERVEGYRLTF